METGSEVMRKGGKDSMEKTDAQTGRQGLNRDVIKYIAIVNMLLYHIAHVFLSRGTVLHEIFEDVGYFTAPVMCYFLVEGYVYTRSKVRYGLRLLLFTVISQMPFYLALRISTEGLPFMCNMFYTLFCSFLLLVAREKIANPVWRGAVCAMLVIATIIGDWQIFAALLVLLLAQDWGDRKKMMMHYGMIAFVYFLFITRNYMWENYGLPASLLHGFLGCSGILAAGVVVLFCYNGRRAKYGRNFSKWFFYIFYPAHLLVLYLVSVLMQR